jgi:hypothetical protein
MLAKKVDGRFLWIPFLLTAILTVLKTINFIDWKWYWLFSPICIFGILMVLFFIGFLFFSVFRR